MESWHIENLTYFVTSWPSCFTYIFVQRTCRNHGLVLACDQVWRWLTEYNIASCRLSHPIYPETQWVIQDTVQLYADTQRSCEDRVDSYTILLHVDSAIQFILILNELLRIQFNFMLTPKGAVRIELILLCFSYSKFNVYNFYHYRIMLFSYCKQLSILSVCESVYLWDGLCVLKDMCRG